jgi:hypothetical protein
MLAHCKEKKNCLVVECEASFQQLKHLLIYAPILRIVDIEKDYLVYIDACKEGLGGVLMQEGKVFCY